MAITQLKTNGADLSRLRNDKQRRFCLEWLIDKNQVQAAIRAGYSPSCAAQTACKLMKNPIIAAFCGKQERLDVEKLGLDREETLRQLFYALTRRAADFFDDNGHILPPHLLPEHCQSIVDGFKAKVVKTTINGEVTEQETEVEYKLTPHATAREQAMKHKGLFEADKEKGNVLVLDFNDLTGRPDVIIDTVEVKLLEDEERSVIPPPINGNGSNGNGHKNGNGKS